MQTTTTRDSEVVSAARAGVTAIAPLVIGFAPFALVVGATIGAASNHEAGIAGSWLIYGGSAQIATVRSRNGRRVRRDPGRAPHQHPAAGLQRVALAALAGPAAVVPRDGRCR